MICNFERFEKGHWYIFTGEEKDIRRCNIIPEIKNKIIKHTPMKCDQVSDEVRFYAFFGGIGGDDWRDCFDLWIEIKDPTTIQPIDSNEYYYNYKTNTINTNAPFDSCSGNPCYALTRHPLNIKKESRMERATHIKLSDNDPDSMIPLVTSDELSCECYAFDKERTVQSISRCFIGSAKIIGIVDDKYVAETYAEFKYAIPIKRADEVMKYISNVKLSDLKKGMKVKIKNDPVWYDQYKNDVFDIKGKVVTITSTDHRDWGKYSSDYRGGFSIEEDGANNGIRYPLNYIEKIVEDKKEYIKGTDFYIGEKVRVKNIKDIKFKHIDEKNVLDACLKVEVKCRCLNTKLFEELFIYPKHKTKYIKLNKKPIKKVKEYKVHKKEYIPLNK